MLSPGLRALCTLTERQDDVLLDASTSYCFSAAAIVLTPPDRYAFEYLIAEVVQSAAEIPFLYPSFLPIFGDVGSHHLNLRENTHQSL